MNGRCLAGVALTSDAAYCAAVGTLLVTVRSPLGRVVRLPSPAVAAAGVATTAWAALLARQASERAWREPIRRIAAANVVASGALLLVAALHPSVAARLIVGAVAIDVAASGVVQAAVLLGEDADERDDRGPRV